MQFKLPDLGEGVQEGEITKWMVQAGDTVREDQSLLEVMTDKVTAEIPSPWDGVVEALLEPEGAVIPVGTPLVSIRTAEEVEGNGSHPEASNGSHGRSDAAPLTVSAGASVKPDGKVRAVPLVRKLAKELGVDLALLAGTGPAGRITEADVRAAAERPSATDHRPPTTGPEPRPRRGERPASAERAPSTQRRAPGGGERIPLRGLRRRIAERMVQSLQTAAPVTYVDEVDVTELVALREKARATAERQGVKLTYLPFFMKAVAAALRAHPKLNASVDEEKQEIVLKQEYHLGVACETEEGLLVPVIRDVDRKSIFDLAREIEAAVEKARSGRLGREDLQGGTFTVTSLGALGGLFATPILNPPEVGILGIHKIARRPVCRGDEIVPREIAHLSLTFDHRVIDGADAARFVSTVISHLEDPSLLLFT